MHVFPRRLQSRRVAIFAVALVMLAMGAAIAWFRPGTPSQPTFADVWGGLTGRESSTGAEAERVAPALAPSLAELLPGLEAKAAANPADTGTQILLAQTYHELGRRADGLAVLARLAKARPKDGEIAFARASLLSQGKDNTELRRAFDLYGSAAALVPHLAPLARLHQGEIRVRLGDRPGAIRIWREHLARFPQDSHRALFEAAIAQVAGG